MHGGHACSAVLNAGSLTSVLLGPRCALLASCSCCTKWRGGIDERMPAAVPRAVAACSGRALCRQPLRPCGRPALHTFHLLIHLMPHCRRLWTCTASSCATASSSSTSASATRSPRRQAGCLSLRFFCSSWLGWLRQLACHLFQQLLWAVAAVPIHACAAESYTGSLAVAQALSRSLAAKKAGLLVSGAHIACLPS